MVKPQARGLLVAVIVTASMTCSRDARAQKAGSPEEIVWDSGFEGDVLPEAMEWPWDGHLGENTEASVADGVLRVVDKGTQRMNLRFYVRSWHAEPSLGATVEARVRVVSCSGQAGVLLMVADGEHEAGLTFYPDRLNFHTDDPALVCRMTTTDDYHIYRLWVRGNDLRLWVDGKLVVDGRGKFTKKAHEGRNLVGFGSCTSPDTGEALWDYVRYAVGRPKVKLAEGMRHVVVYKQAGVYGCFPSLRRGVGEALYTSFGTRLLRSHIDDRGGGATRRSADGGDTWAETKDYPPDPDEQRKDSGVARAAAYGWRYVSEDKKAELEAKGFEVRPVREGVVAYLSGAYAIRRRPGQVEERWEIPPPPGVSLMAFNQSANVKARSGVRLCAVYGLEKPGGLRNSWVLRSENDGDSWELLPIVRQTKLNGIEPLQPEAALDRPGKVQIPQDGMLGFSETALVEAPDGTVIAMMRPDPDTHGYLYQSVSADGGKTWSAPRRTPMWGYPANLLLLKDGSILCTYGYRRAPMGIRACLSRDNGRTWDIANELVLRADGQGNPGDLGYPITLQMEGGHLITVYYFTVGDGITHVVATHWRLPSR